jgi:hypothetical protein
LPASGQLLNLFFNEQQGLPDKLAIVKVSGNGRVGQVKKISWG